MPLSTIRQMTDEDQERMEAAAARFCERHNIRRYPEDSALQTVEYATTERPGESDLEAIQRKRLVRLWLAAFRSAVRSKTADSYGYGYIGYNVP